MRILLICPKYDGFSGYSPTSLAILAQYAEMQGHNVDIVDLNIEKLPKKTYDLVGITGLSLWKHSIMETSKEFDCPVIVGGPWPSLHPIEALSCSTIDYVCMGEGEETFNAFLKAYPRVEAVRGIGYKNNGLIHINASRSFIQDLDNLPLPAWRLLKTEQYRRVSVITSRSCPFHCIFCSVHTLLGPKWRARSVHSVIEEIELLVNYHHAKHITFGDDNLNVKPDRLMQLFQEIIDRKITCEFDAIQGLRADRLPFKLLRLMKKVGFTEVIVAPESGSQRVLDEIIDKHLDLSVVEPVVKECKRLGLQCGAFFVIGFPWETMEEIKATIKFADKLRKYGCSCYVGNALPYPDTELHRRAKQEGYLRFDGEELERVLFYLKKPRETHCLSSPYWQPEQVIKICNEELKKNLRSIYTKYSAKKILSKFLRHPLRSLKRASRVL